MSYFLYLVFRFVVFIFKWTPFFIIYGLSNILYYILYYIVRYRRKVVRSNLQKAFPNKSESEIINIEKLFYRHLCDIFLEGVKGFGLSKEQAVQRWKSMTSEVVDKFTAQGRSVLLVGGHYNNWEWGIFGSKLQLQSNKIIIIYKPIGNQYIERYIQESRSMFQTMMRPLQETSKAFAEHQDEANVFILLSDQSPSNLQEAHWVDFFGIKTASLHGAAKYAQLHNLPIVFFDTQKKQRGYYEIWAEVLAEHPRDYTPEQLTQLFMKRLEQQITAQPQYWLWSHKRWKHEFSAATP